MPRFERFTIPSDGVVQASTGRTPAAELLELLRPPAWHADAACKEHPDLDWFDSRQAAATAAVCAGCLVLEECGRFAKTSRAAAGVWGGLDRTPKAERPRVPLPPNPTIDDLVRWFVDGGVRPIEVARLLNAEQVPPPPGDVVWRAKHVTAVASSSRAEPDTTAA